MMLIDLLINQIFSYVIYQSAEMPMPVSQHCVGKLELPE